MDSAWLEAVIVKNTEENIVKIFDVEYDSTMPKGQHFYSEIIGVSFSVLLESGDRKIKKIIVKMLGNNSTLSNSIMFRCEIKMYKDVFVKMLKLCDEFEDRSEKLWPSMLDCKPYNMIILEDLTDQNYKLVDRRECLDLKHSELVLKRLGKFHAMSRILLDRSLIAAGDGFKLLFAAFDSPSIRNLLEGGLRGFAGAIMSSWPSKWKCFGEQMIKESSVIFTKLKALYEIEANAFNVINHGDPWTSNIMFKYSDNNDPVEVRFIDFQLSHINSYMWDIIYFTYSSIKASIRREMFDHLLTVYQESLETSLKFYGYEGIIPTIEDVRLEAKRLQYLEFVVLAIFFPVMISSLNDPYQRENLYSSEGEPKCAVNSEAWKSEKYMENTVEDFERFTSNGIFG